MWCSYPQAYTRMAQGWRGRWEPATQKVGRCISPFGQSTCFEASSGPVEHACVVFVSSSIPTRGPRLARGLGGCYPEGRQMQISVRPVHVLRGIKRASRARLCDIRILTHTYAWLRAGAGAGMLLPRRSADEYKTTGPSTQNSFNGPLM
jgi:hypothetical protein